MTSEQLVFPFRQSHCCVMQVKPRSEWPNNPWSRHTLLAVRGQEFLLKLVWGLWLEGSELMGWATTYFLCCFLWLGVQSCILQFFAEHPSLFKWSKGQQGSRMHVVTAAGLRSTFDCMSAVFKSKYSICIELPLENPAPPANWPLLFVFWRSQLLFINDEIWYWYKDGRAEGFLFLSAAFSNMQHSGGVA